MVCTCGLRPLVTLMAALCLAVVLLSLASFCFESSVISTWVSNNLTSYTVFLFTGAIFWSLILTFVFA